MGEWFKDWFASDFYLSVYSHRNDEDASKFLNKVLSFVSVPAGSKVLDAACGAGRHSVIMAQKGFDVTAFDLSQPLLDKAIEKAVELNLNIKFSREDLRYVSYNERFNLILNIFTSFGYFYNDDENFAFIRSAYNMQEEEGVFIFDYLNEKYLRGRLVPSTRKIVNGFEVLEEREIKNNRVVKKITIRKDNDSLDYEESVQLYSFNEIIERFKEIGYKAVKSFGSYECTPFIPDESDRIIIIFQK